MSLQIDDAPEDVLQHIHPNELIVEERLGDIKVFGEDLLLIPVRRC